MAAIRQRTISPTLQRAHRIGNVYYPRFGFGAGAVAGATDLDDMLEEIRAAVEAVGADACEIESANARLSRMCLEGGRKVSRVISTIEGVAFETSLLALNAAIEAGAEGADGADVALVAAEIRDLVRRSATATGEMRALLHDNLRRTDAGFRLVDEVGTTLADIVRAVRQVTEILAELGDRRSEETRLRTPDAPITA